MRYKKCSICGNSLPLTSEYYPKNKNNNDGFEYACRECKKVKSKLWYLKNKERKGNYRKEYSEHNKEYYLNYYRQYYIDNPNAFFNYNSKNRIGLNFTPISNEQYNDMIMFFDNKCAFSGVELNIDNISRDHLIPINKNGQHVIWNIVPMDRFLNASKGDMDYVEWYKEQSFYSDENLKNIYDWIEYAKTKYQLKNTK